MRALCDYAAQVTKDPASAGQAEVDALRAAGWSDDGVHDAIQVIAFFNYINRIADAVGIEPEPDWKASG